MAFPQQVTRVTISGESFGGLEEWTTGFYVGKPEGNSGTPTLTQAAAIGAAWKTFFQDASSKFGNKHTATQVKMARLNTDGSTVVDSAIYSPISPAAVGTSTTTHPAQIALVATLASNTIARGLGAKGRMYLPGICASVADDGHISVTDRNNIATRFKTFLDAVNTAIDTDDQVILASKGRTTPTVAAGVIVPVAKIRIGNVLDTQRRRRNQLQEQYQEEFLTGFF